MTFDELCEEYAKQDSFMEPELTYKIKWRFVVHTATDDRFWCPANELPEDPGYQIDGDIIIGYGARLTAPGYLDCTEWVVFDTVQEAIDYLESMYLD